MKTTRRAIGFAISGLAAACAADPGPPPSRAAPATAAEPEARDAAAASHAGRPALLQRLEDTIETVRRDARARVVVRLDVPNDQVAVSQRAWTTAMARAGVDLDRAAVRNFRTRPYMSLRLEADDLRRIVDDLYDAKEGVLRVDTPQGPIRFELEADVRVVQHAAAAGAPMDVALERTQARDLHALGHLGEGATIVIIDDGVSDLDHFLDGGGQSRIVAGGAFTSRVPELCNGSMEMSCLERAAGFPLSGASGAWSHGTKIAFVAAGSALEIPGFLPLAERRVSGIAPGARIVSLRVADADGGIWLDDVAAALDAVASNEETLEWGAPVHAVNLSLGVDGAGWLGDCEPSGTNEVRIGELVGDLRARGVPVVVSAGNDGRCNVPFPACLENVVTVAYCSASAPQSQLSNWSTSVDLVAPASGLVIPKEGGTQTASGTSMAAPEVAAAIALLRAAFPDCELDVILEALTQHTTSLPSLEHCGHAVPQLLVADAAAWLEEACGATYGPGE